MERSGKKGRGRGAKGKPPKSGENEYVISFEDARAYRGQIVAVDRFPKLGGYAKVIAHADGLEELKQHLEILGVEATASVHVYPGLDVCCYVIASRKKPQIKRKGE